MKIPIVLIMTFMILNNSYAGEDYLSNWPKDASPEEIGKRLAEDFVSRKFEFEKDAQRNYVTYKEACAWYGALVFAEATQNRDLIRRLIDKYGLLDQSKAIRICQGPHVDYRVFGIVPLELYLLTKDKKYLKTGLLLADKQWEDPKAGGITREARYWIDDMYMITTLQVQAYRVTGDIKYINRAILTMKDYIDKLQQPNGLFYHGADAPFYWGRGNGWVAAGMAELLNAIPEKHPSRASVMESYKRMMDALLNYQGKDGLWKQLIDNTDAWQETSCSAMFTFAMVTGIKNGWLEPNIYGSAARKAWLALVKNIDNDANVNNICAGTSKWTSDKGDPIYYYLNRPRIVGDLHGQAAVLWSAYALLR